MDKVQIACGDDNAYQTFKKQRLTKMVKENQVIKEEPFHRKMFTEQAKLFLK